MEPENFQKISQSSRPGTGYNDFGDSDGFAEVRLFGRGTLPGGVPFRMNEAAAESKRARPFGRAPSKVIPVFGNYMSPATRAMSRKMTQIIRPRMRNRPM